MNADIPFYCDTLSLPGTEGTEETDRASTQRHGDTEVFFGVAQMAESAREPMPASAAPIGKRALSCIPVATLLCNCFSELREPHLFS